MAGVSYEIPFIYLDSASPHRAINTESAFCMVLEGLFVGEGIFNLKDDTFYRGSLKTTSNNTMI